jgi:hypothetical protein
MFTRADHGTYLEPDEFILHPTTLFQLAILILPSHLCQGLLSGILHSGFAARILYIISLFMPGTCTAHFILLDLIILIAFSEEYKL